MSSSDRSPTSGATGPDPGVDFVPPILLNKDYRAPSLFQPENLLREARRQKHLLDLAVPRVCVLDPDGDIVRHLASSGDGTRHLGWACYHTDMWVTDLHGLELGVVGLAVGAPFAVLVAEQLFASGAELIISVTSAGQIKPVADPPYFVLINKALRDEGTSLHYQPPAAWSRLPDQLERALALALQDSPESVLIGASWTTDAPYRETETAINAAMKDDVICVEMEAAALYAYAAAQSRNIVCLAHITNTMALTEYDFEKGEANGAHSALAIAEAIANALTVPTQLHASAGLRAQDMTITPNESMERQRLLERLASIGIVAPIVPYPAHTNIEEGKRLRGDMAGTFTKNLLLKDKKGRLFFVTAFEDTTIDLKMFHTRVGGQGRVSFADPETMHEILRVGPGTATPLALMNDEEGNVTLVFDSALLDANQMNFHPMTHTESIGLTLSQFDAFLQSCGHPRLTLDLQ